MQRRSIFWNFVLGGGAQAAGRLVRFGSASLVMRLDGGAASWGQIAYALAVFTYVGFILEMGLTTLAQIHETDHPHKDRLFFLALGPLRFLLAVPLVAGAVGVIWWLNPAGSDALLVYLSLLLFKPWIIDWYCQRKGDYSIVPMLQLIRQGLLFLGLWLGWIDSVRQVIVWDLLLEVTAGLVLWWLGPGHRFGHLWPNSRERGELKTLYRASLTLFAANALLMLHQNVDIFVIRSVLGLEQVGIYDYSYRLALFVVFAASALSAPLRRQLGRIANGDASVPMEILMQSAQKFLSLLALAFSLFSMYFAPDFFEWTLRASQVDSAVQVVRILSVYVLFSFVSVPLGEWLLTHRPHREYLRLSWIAGLANLSCNLVLVFAWGLNGAAGAKVIAEILILVYLLWKAPRTLMLLQLPALTLLAYQLCWLGLSLVGVPMGMPGLILHLLGLLLLLGAFRFFSLAWLRPLFRL